MAESKSHGMIMLILAHVHHTFRERERERERKKEREGRREGERERERGKGGGRELSCGATSESKLAWFISIQNLKPSIHNCHRNLLIQEQDLDFGTISSCC